MGSSKEPISGLPPPAAAPPSSSATRRKVLIALSLLTLPLLLLFPCPISSLSSFSPRTHLDHGAHKPPVTCPSQPRSLSPAHPFSPPANFTHAAALRWSKAVQIPTPSWDDFGAVGEDRRYEVFPPFAAYLREAWPIFHERLELEKVNTHGLLYTWKGSDPSLEPLLLMAHQDVVPVPPETLSRWTYPPFSGHIGADGWVWGRGVGDCKNLLTSLFEAVTLLIEQGFEPRRTVLIPLGFDEEVVQIPNAQGAAKLAARIEELYGRDSVFLLVDEGGGMADDLFGASFALPGMGEKGYFDVKVSVAVPGGHSSVPPEHTGIGILAKLISALEAHPYSPRLDVENPFTTFTQCAASHAPDLDESLRGKLRDVRRWDEAAREIGELDLSIKYLMQTTQAIDIVHGGVKINALPELASFTFNQRLSVSTNSTLIQQRITRILRPVTEGFNLTWIGFGDERDVNDVDVPGGRAVKVERSGWVTERAPVTPAEGGAWDVFAGTIRHLFPAPDEKDRIVSPFISTGNTDTRWYWNLTKNIYRFQGVLNGQSLNAHTVDERAHIDGHISSIKFLHALIQNADAHEAN